MKKLIALVLVLLLALGLAACGGQNDPPAPATPAPQETPDDTTDDTPDVPDEPGEAGSRGTIAVVCFVTSAPYFSSGEQAAIAMGNSLGYDVIWTGTPLPDTPGLIDIITNLIEQDIDALVVASGDATSIVPITQRAMERGIKVITFDLDIAEEGRHFHAGISDVNEFAVPMLEGLVEAIGDEGEYAIITGLLTNEFTQGRIYHFIDMQESMFPNLTLVAVEGSEEDPEVGYAAAMNILTAHPNVRAIVSNVSTMLAPIARAIEDAGMVGQVYATGMSTPNLARPGLVSGATANAFLWDTARMQEWAVMVAVMAIEGTIDDVPMGPANIPGWPEAVRISEDVLYFGESLFFRTDNINDFDF